MKNTLNSIALALLCSASAGFATAAPFVPPTDAVVLERVTPGVEARRWKGAIEREPRNLETALRFATLLVEQSRRESDPRPLGRAQAVLAPWWNDADAPVAVLVLRATIKQSVHDFAPARADLERAVAREPRNAQAWLTLATIQQVTGDLAAARASCARLAGLAPVIVHATCAASVDGASGRGAAALSSLTAAIEQSPRAPPGLLAWAVTLQAELAQRQAQTELAERAFRAALVLDPADSYAIGAYADFLLEQARPLEVLKLIPADTASDPLLLRYGLAARAARAPGAQHAVETLAQRFAAAQARGDRVHLREEARFALHVRGDAAAALALAMRNWQVQKEPADARIALEAAVAARDPGAVREVVAWVRSTALEDAAIARLVAGLGRA